jgi:hypothetical protein
MNKFVTTALALTAAGSLSYADPGDNEWLELDGEINSLASALQPSSQDGMGWAILLRFTYTYSSSDIATNGNNAPFGSDADISGFEFQDVDLAFWGSVAEYGYRVSADIDGNGSKVDDQGDVSSESFALEDAYGYWDCGGYVTATAGQFKANTFRSASIDPENQLFIDRTALGGAHDFWDLGVQTHGDYEAFSYWASAQNGANGDQSDHYYSVRVEWAYNAGAGTGTGAMGGNDELNFTVGAAYAQHDAGLVGGNEDDLVGIDVAGNFSSFGFAGEYAHLGDDAFRGTGNDVGEGTGFPLVLVPDSNPWAIMASFLINPEWEVAARYEDLDNDDSLGDDNDILSVAVVWYRSGNNAKWTAQWSDYGADGDDGSIFQIGLTLGATR